ncbi:hypothetical protein [Spirillospora albida]|uniref:hypothetical protein n=1 Tax=Spirillospora albida TaxID=58123 RepID=UPI0004C0537A|nr:hypothetical protein [Spirillospora albida]
MTTIEDVTITGDGAQSAFGNTVSRDLILTQLTFVRGRPSMVLSEAEVVERVAAYVPVLNHDEIVETLRRSHVVALAGPAGAGAATAAIAALRQLRPGLPIRLFSTGEDDVEEIGATEPRGYLVRAGDEEESRLRSCLEAVRASGGFLLTVGTAAELRRFADFLRPVPVQPPPADEVYRRRLLRRGLGETCWPDWPQARELLKDALPGDARRLADLVADLHLEGGDERDVSRAYRGWAEQLRGWFGVHSAHRDQTLMVAAATITPADETSVYGAALSLARQLKVEVAGGGLAWCPSTGLSELLDAEREDGRIVFRRPGFAQAVLRHVWNDYPLARLDLLAWLSSLPADDAIALEAPLRIRIASVFADLAAEHGAVEKVVQTAGRWAGGAQRADLAYVALARTCLHPLIGGRIRRRLYEWSKERRAPQTLKLTVVRVCQVLGETHMSIALTRLKHLATHGDEQVQDEVFEVVRALSETRSRVVFEAVIAWCHSATTLSGGDAARRIRVGLRVLLFLLGIGESSARPAAEPAVHRVVALIGRLATRDDAQVRAELLAAARGLAAAHPMVVLEASLAWAGNSEAYRPDQAVALATTATELFLALAAERDVEGLPVILTGTASVTPTDCLAPWSVALSAEAAAEAGYARDAAFRNFEDITRLWLDAACRRPGLRQGIVSLFVQAADHDPARRRLVMEIVQRWSGQDSERRRVKEDVDVWLLQPEWKRLLLRLWVRLRRAATGER